MRKYQFTASQVCDAFEVHDVTLRSWRNRYGLITDAGEEGRRKFSAADMLRIAAVVELNRYGLGIEHSVAIVNRQRGLFDVVGEHYATRLEDWPAEKWSGPFIMTGDRLNRAHDKYFMTSGELFAFLVDRGPYPVTIIVDIGRLARLAILRLGRPYRAGDQADAPAESATTSAEGGLHEPAQQ